MNTDFSLRDLCGVFAVPPLARRAAAAREIDFSENDRIVRHVLAGGIRSLIYGGNAFLYHLTLGEYDQLLGWLSLWDRELWLIPSVGPSFGRAMDQAQILRRYQFKCVMVLPCGDPRDAPGLELGYSEFVEASGVPLIIYLKEENSFGADRIAGLDAIARLVNEKQCIGIKYAIVREHPRDDPYLEALLDRVDKKLVISGIGERPAVVHLKDWGLPGFTTGSGCVAPRLSTMLHRACANGEFGHAEELRLKFMALEDLRDKWGPARVLHKAIELADLAITGIIPPYISALAPDQVTTLAPVVEKLLLENQSCQQTVSRLEVASAPSGQ